MIIIEKYLINNLFFLGKDYSFCVLECNHLDRVRRSSVKHRVSLKEV